MSTKPTGWRNPAGLFRTAGYRIATLKTDLNISLDGRIMLLYHWLMEFLKGGVLEQGHLYSDG
jgi:hypothetical protein